MKKKFFLTFTLAFISLSTFAQQPEYISNGALLDGKSMIKVNLTSLAFKSGGFSAERVISKHISVVAGIGFLPTGNIPFVSMLSDATTDESLKNVLNTTTVSNFSFSPELRIYLGKGYGKGFYISPYYRYDNFKLNKLPLDFDVAGQQEQIIFNGNLSAHSGGLQLGYQWLLGKKRNILIDWTIIGAHYGSSAGNLTSVLERTLTPIEVAEAQKELDNLLNDLPIVEAKGTVEPNKAAIDVKGPWVFPRGSLSVGFRF